VVILSLVCFLSGGSSRGPACARERPATVPRAGHQAQGCEFAATARRWPDIFWAVNRAAGTETGQACWRSSWRCRGAACLTDRARASRRPRRHWQHSRAPTGIQPVSTGWGLAVGECTGRSAWTGELSRQTVESRLEKAGASGFMTREWRRPESRLDHSLPCRGVPAAPGGLAGLAGNGILEGWGKGRALAAVDRLVWRQDRTVGLTGAPVRGPSSPVCP